MAEPEEETLAEHLLSLKSEDQPYFEHLGRFITTYALAEAGVHQLARHFSGLDDAEARIVFGGMRLVDITRRVRQLLRHRGALQEFEEVDALFNQLDAISTQRDKMVHRDVTYARAALIVDNKATAKSLASVEEDSFSIEDIWFMTADCIAIFNRMLFIIDPEYLASTPEWARAWQRKPWRYTPSPPNPPAKPPREDRQSRKRQRRASPK